MVLDAAKIGEFVTIAEWEFDSRADAQYVFDQKIMSDKVDEVKDGMQLPTWYVFLEKGGTGLDVKRRDLYRDGVGSRFNC